MIRTSGWGIRTGLEPHISLVLRRALRGSAPTPSLALRLFPMTRHPMYRFHVANVRVAAVTERNYVVSLVCAR